MDAKQSRYVYLGDSVYANFDGYAIELTTNNGLPTDPSNRIVLDPIVLEALNMFYKSCIEAWGTKS